MKLVLALVVVVGVVLAIANYMIGPELERDAAREAELDDEWGPMY